MALTGFSKFAKMNAKSFLCIILNSLLTWKQQGIFAPHISWGLLLKSKELSISKNEKGGTRTPYPISFTNQPISCPVRFLSFCLPHSTPKMKPCPAVYICSTFKETTFWPSSSHTPPHKARKATSSQPRTSRRCSRHSGLQKSPHLNSQACFYGHMIQPCLKNHPMGQAQLEEVVLKHARNFSERRFI